MWQVRDSLLEELCLLERVVGQSDANTSAVMKERLGWVLRRLAIDYLDEGDHRTARSTATRLLRLRLRWRDAVLLGLAVLPESWTAGLRKARSGLRKRFRPQRSESKLPAWAGSDKA